jgi:hypothetical protein
MLELTEIQQTLRSKFGDLTPRVAALTLDDARDDFDFDRVERSLQVEFDPTTRVLLSRYSFEELSLGPISFGDGRSYGDWLIRLNTAGDGAVPWWGKSERPRGVLLVATSDEYAILLNTMSGEISALKYGTPIGNEFVVARSLNFFLRGAGTIFVQRESARSKADLGEQVAVEANGNSGSRFWNWVAS